MKDRNAESVRPWGYYDILLDSDYCKVKKLVIKPKEQTSYQYHHHREESWTIVQGFANIVLNGVSMERIQGQSINIPLNTKHRIHNPSTTEDLVLIEVQTGTYFGEDDIVRIEDSYDRDLDHDHSINMWKPKWEWREDEI